MLKRRKGKRIMRYGLPYQGSKNAIAEDIIHFLPSAENFYDLFCGGCAITHAALYSQKWNNYYANDIDGAMPELFINAINGKFKNEKRWISREEFRRLKNEDPYISLCWSFGNCRENYLYSKELEYWKKALHYARVFNDYSELEKFGIKSDGSAADIKAHEQEYKEKYIAWYVKNIQKSKIEYETLKKNLTEKITRGKEELRAYLCEALEKSGFRQSDINKRLGTQMSGHYFGRSQWEFPTREVYNQMREFMPLDKEYDEIYGLQNLLESLQSLQSLQRLQSLQSLQSLESLEISNKSYEKIEIKPNSVIYCDIPYEGTKGYIDNEFNHKAFYDWACEQKEPVYISSYNIADKRFEVVWKTQSTGKLSGTGCKAITERLFAPKGQKQRFIASLFDLL